MALLALFLSIVQSDKANIILKTDIFDSFFMIQAD